MKSNTNVQTVSASTSTKIAGLLVFGLCAYISYKIIIDNSGIGYLFLPLLVYGAYYFVSPLFNQINFDNNLRIRSLNVNKTVKKSEVEEWGTFKTYAGGKFGIKSVLLVKLRNHSQIIYPLSQTFEMGVNLLMSKYKNFFGKNPKNYGIKFLLLDSFLIK